MIQKMVCKGKEKCILCNGTGKHPNENRPCGLCGGTGTESVCEWVYQGFMDLMEVYKCSKCGRIKKEPFDGCGPTIFC
jgi:DnaJ-class molecular chaperone